MLNRIFSKKFLYSFFIVFITGLICRYFIYIYCGVNVFTDMFNKISLIYYAFMALYIPTVKEIVYLLTDNALMMNASGVNPPGGAGEGSGSGSGSGSGTGTGTGTGIGVGVTEVTPNLTGGAGENTSRNNKLWVKVMNGNVSSWVNSATVDGTWGDLTQGIASKANGPLKINDPANQAVRGYSTNSTNQPFAQNMAAALDHQYKQASTNGVMHSTILNESHQGFLMGFLRSNHPELYNSMMGPKGRITWNKLYNRKFLRDSLVNTP